MTIDDINTDTQSGRMLYDLCVAAENAGVHWATGDDDRVGIGEPYHDSEIYVTTERYIVTRHSDWAATECPAHAVEIAAEVDHDDRITSLCRGRMNH